MPGRIITGPIIRYKISNALPKNTVSITMLYTTIVIVFAAEIFSFVSRYKATPAPPTLVGETHVLNSHKTISCRDFRHEKAKSEFIIKRIVKKMCLITYIIKAILTQNKVWKLLSNFLSSPKSNCRLMR